MEKSELKQIIREEIERTLKENSQVNNDYVEEIEEDLYILNPEKVIGYLEQYEDDEICARSFVEDDEGWEALSDYLEDVELMSNKELEEFFLEEMNQYYFGSPE